MTNEKAELNSERVWKELSRALMEPHPRAFFDTLLHCDVLHSIFPEVYVLKSSLESFKWHPEGNAYEHTMLVLTAGVNMDFDLEGRLACLVHDFGKGVTPRDKMPSHFCHEITGVPIVEKFCNRLSVPAKMRDRVMKTTRYHMFMHNLDKLKAKTVVNMFMDMGALNDPAVVDLLYKVGCADERGRLGSENNSVDHCHRLYDFFNAFKSVKFADVFPNGEKDTTKIKEKMFQARVQAVNAA